ncbi:MAG: hypothetical protein KatS3mg111_4079 [Pirellulaceae bacterium]|nr:MAG: hypothetical protein KatS3mg111_4079 [Pirellulaceae bacterium]
MGRFSRRLFVAGGLVTSLGTARKGLASSTLDIPVRTITHGPKFYWFGYYDKLELDPTNRFVLANEVEFEHCFRLASHNTATCSRLTCELPTGGQRGCPRTSPSDRFLQRLHRCRKC